MSEEALTITNPSYAEYLETTAGKIIAEQAAEIKALLAENERMREALQAVYDEVVQFGNPGSVATECARIARAALAGKP